MSSYLQDSAFRSLRERSYLQFVRGVPESPLRKDVDPGHWQDRPAIPRSTLRERGRGRRILLRRCQQRRRRVLDRASLSPISSRRCRGPPQTIAFNWSRIRNVTVATVFPRIRRPEHWYGAEPVCRPLIGLGPSSGLNPFLSMLLNSLLSPGTSLFPLLAADTLFSP